MFRYSAILKVWKEKVEKSQAKGKHLATNRFFEKELAKRYSTIKFESKIIVWAKISKSKSFDLSLFKNNMPKKS